MCRHWRAARMQVQLYHQQQLIQEQSSLRRWHWASTEQGGYQSSSSAGMSAVSIQWCDNDKLADLAG